jgi:hypothetical protein
MIAGFSPALLRPVYTLYWNSHREAITRDWCENKDKPERKCAGKCQLKKQIQTQDNGKNQTFPYSACLLQEWDILSNDLEGFKFTDPGENLSARVEVMESCLMKGYLRRQEHPPCRL